MSKSYHDLETYSETPLKHGVHRYAEKAEILIWVYALEDGPVHAWDVTTGEPMPASLAAIIDDPDCELWFHNGGQFDRVIIKHAMPDVYARMPLHRWRDTLVQALAHSLPGSLDRLCEILQLPQDDRKLKTGKTLITTFCKPAPKNQKLRRATRETHPALWQEFVDYARMDIVSMRAVHAKCPKWNFPANPRELALWHLDLTINDRGIAVDVELAEAAIRAVDRTQKDLAARTKNLTDGEVAKATQRDALLKHLLAEYNVDLPDLKKATLERRIADPNLPEPLREMLAIRLEASMTSTSKYQTLLNGVSSDGRLRGLLQFCGANRTGRWAARMFQPQNMPRPDVPLILKEMRADKLTDEVMAAYLEQGVDALKNDSAHLVFDNVMGLTGNIVRGCIVAPSSKQLSIADLANIEGRMAAWLAGEDWKLKAFREYDAGTGPDLYKVAYGRSFSVPVDSVTKEQRQLGKVQELALGYEGGVGAFVTMAMTYKMELLSIAAAVFSALDELPQDIVKDAFGFYEWAKKKRKTLGLEKEVFIACEILKRGWRAAHPGIVALWGELRDAVIQAIRHPGVTLRAGRVKVRRDGTWLRLQLPSGRHLCYPSPEVSDAGEISYMGLNSYTRKWQRIKTYGGKLFENLCQAAARDVLAHNMPALEEAGCPIVLSVHDELLTEPEDSFEFNHEEVARIMSTNPHWADGLPLAAAGFDTYRYRKD
jgi:DNA polymerase